MVLVMEETPRYSTTTATTAAVVSRDANSSITSCGGRSEML